MTDYKSVIRTKPTKFVSIHFKFLSFTHSHNKSLYPIKSIQPNIYDLRHFMITSAVTNKTSSEIKLNSYNFLNDRPNISKPTKNFISMTLL